jgi:SAM-dependent methyltransferase
MCSVCAAEERTSPGAKLLSATGRELLGRLAGADVSQDRVLALAQSLRQEYPAELVAAALTQQALRVAGTAKFSRADQMLFTRAGLEQASSELTARHAARRFAGALVVADLCCGIGGNLTALAAARPGGVTIGVDSDLVSLEFARHNAAVLAPAARLGFACADVRTVRLNRVDALLVDPARRDAKGRLPAGRYLPALEWCIDLTGTVPRVAIKAAPGLRKKLVPPGWEIEFVAVGRELKEAMLWSPALARTQTTATVLPDGDTLTCTDPAAHTTTPAPPGEYLFDPNPAVTRAGLVAKLAGMLGAWQIDPMIAFLSADEPKFTPFARTLRVIESAPWHERRFAARLRDLGIGTADIRRRGLAGDVAQIHRRLGLRGPGAAVVVLTRVSDRPWGLICVPVTPDGPAAPGARAPGTAGP